MEHSQYELEHAARARALRKCFATALAMERMHKIALGPAKHHHGFTDCYGKKKQYFFRRAKWLLKEFPAFNGKGLVR